MNNANNNNWNEKWGNNKEPNGIVVIILVLAAIGLIMFAGLVSDIRDEQREDEMRQFHRELEDQIKVNEYNKNHPNGPDKNGSKYHQSNTTNKTTTTNSTTTNTNTNNKRNSSTKQTTEAATVDTLDHDIESYHGDYKEDFEDEDDAWDDFEDDEDVWDDY